MVVGVWWRDAFRSRFLTADGHLVDSSMSAAVSALGNGGGLLNAAERELAAEQLVNALVEHRYQIDLVPVAVAEVLPVLTDLGRLDMAYMVLLQTTERSWFGQVRQGRRLISRGGPADMAEVGIMRWILASMLGVTCLQAGYRRLQIRPRPPIGAGFQAGSPVQVLSALLPGVFGEWRISWEIKPGCFELQVLVPPGCVAEAILPDGLGHQINSGAHVLTMAFDQGGDGVPTLVDLARDG